MRVACDNREAAHLAADYLERPGHPQPNTALDEPKQPAWGAPPAVARHRAGPVGARWPQVPASDLARQVLEPEVEPFVAGL